MFDIDELIGSVSGKLNNIEKGGLPTDQSIESCGWRLLYSVVGIYLTNGECGIQDFVNKLNELDASLRNKSDPLIKSLGIVKGMAFQTMLTSIRKQKELISVDIEKARQAAVSHTTGDISQESSGSNASTADTGETGEIPTL